MAFGKRNKPDLSNPEQTEEEISIVKSVQKMMNDGFDAKSSKVKTWKKCWEAYEGTYFEQNLSSYKAQEISNFVFATVETIIPIMVAHNPKMLAIPRRSQNAGKAESIQYALDSEWSRANMFSETIKIVRNAAITGTTVFYLPWDGKDDNIGNVKPMVMSPFNVFVDPLATNEDDAEYFGFAMYRNVGEVIKAFPEKAELLRQNTTGVTNEDLTYGKNSSAVDSKHNILYVEVYFKDYSTVSEEVDEDAEDGTKQKVKITKMKYPKGRRVIIAGDVLCHNGENPYSDGKFPFRIYRWYETPGQFWGKGEVENIISPQYYMNDITNSIVESAQLMSNPIWILDKNSGVEKGSLTNRKGLVVRKNPGTEVRREMPPSLPAYIQDVIMMLKQDIEHISGVYDVTRGERPTGITAAAAIEALNEQAQGRIKLHVQLLEDMLGKAGSMWLRRLQQFWESKRDVRIIGADYKVDFSSIDKTDIDGDFDIIVVAGSTQPVNKTARLQQMVQLAQTMGEDGMPMIDRKALLENSDIPNVSEIVARFEQLNQMKMQAAQNTQDNLPKLNVPFEQLPVEGKVQVAAQAGIELTPDMFAQDMMIKQKLELDKMEVEHMYGMEQHDRETKNQLALQTFQNALQSKLGGQTSQNGQNLGQEAAGSPEQLPMAGQPDQEEMAKQQVLERLAQMPPEQVAELAQQNPMIAQLLEEIQNQNLPNNPEMGLGEEM